MRSLFKKVPAILLCVSFAVVADDSLLSFLDGSPAGLEIQLDADHKLLADLHGVRTVYRFSDALADSS